jgi:hypothetical protein
MQNVAIIESIRIDVWENKPLKEWVEKSFRTELERSAAWAMFGHLCNEYCGIRDIIRGELRESTEEVV